MTDLLAIEVNYNNDESITLHQKTYIEKLVAKFLPNGVPPEVQRNTLPYSKSIAINVELALDLPGSTAATPPYPELVKPYQERLGALMYLTTSTRVDVAYPVHLLARAMARPTPALMSEVDHVIGYLARHSGVGLTYERGSFALHGMSDASWEIRWSTSGWVVNWQGAAISWGSRKQDCVALSSCESEIIALSEAANDMVYHRKFLLGLLPVKGETDPSDLSTDNTAARDLCFNPEHHNRTKHVARRHFYVRDMVEKFELTVPFISTNDNLADFLTKPLKSAPRFFELRALIMNEPRVFTTRT